MSCLAHPLNDETLPCERCGAAFCDDCLVMLRNERLCAGCKDEVLRDVTSGMLTTRKPYARITSRLAAYLIDRAIFYAFIIGLAFLERPLRRLGVPAVRVLNTQVVLLALLYTSFFLYEGLMLSARGQTLGKMVTRQQVVRADGTCLSRRQAWGRALVRSLFLSAWYAAVIIEVYDFAVWIFILTLTDSLVALVTPQRTALHDLIARTRVYRIE